MQNHSPFQPVFAHQSLAGTLKLLKHIEQIVKCSCQPFLENAIYLLLSSHVLLNDVLKVSGSVYHEHEGEVALDVYSVNSKKYWLSVYNYGYASDIWYVGVTPNKRYTLKLSTDSETDTESGDVTISYSQSINNQTPKVTDY